MDIRQDISVDYPGVDIGSDSWPVESRHYDRILAIHVLEHIPPEQLTHVFTEAHRVLKVGGVFEIELPHAGTWGANNDLTHQGTGGTTPDVERYFNGGKNQYWDSLNFEAASFAEVTFPTAISRSRRLTLRVSSGHKSHELVKIPLFDATVKLMLTKGDR